MNKIERRFIGTLVGTAVGDALGRPFEGWERIRIEATLGRVKELLPDFPPYNYPTGQYTDDTQLTIAIAESLIRSRGFNLEDLIDRFVDWLSEPPIGPGYGCLTAINRLRRGVPWQEAASESGGNGTAMRISPIGLFFYKDIPLLIKNARISSILTHSHWAATASAIVVARSVAYLLTHDSVDVKDFLGEISSVVNAPEYEDYAQKILDLEEFLKMDSREALIELGGVGIKPPWPNPAKDRLGFIAPYAMSTTLSALYCFLRSPSDFENSVAEAVMGGGDTDTCGAITGSISGAFNGIEGIPERWTTNLVNSKRIALLGSELYEIVHEQ